MLKFAVGRPCKFAGKLHRQIILGAAAVLFFRSLTVTKEAMEWLGPELAHAAQSSLSRGVRVPQELVGWEELKRYETWFPSETLK